MSRGVFARLGLPLLALFLVLTPLIPQAKAQADVKGQWSTLNYSMTINPIHVILMHNGKILVTTGSGNCPASQSGCPSGPPYNGSNHSGAVVVDPIAKSITQLSVSWDMFCNGMTTLADGKVLVTGGTIAYDPFRGIQNTNLFDPATNTFTSVQSMAHGRWYPSVNLLSDGRVMTFSGFDETGATNTTVEFYTEGSGWSSPVSAGWTPPLYPRFHLLPNGKLFYSGSTPVSKIFDPSNRSWTNVDSTLLGSTRTYGSSVLLPLTPANNYDPKVLILGGGNPATTTTELIDLGTSSPAWTWGPDMSQPRIEMDAVILPTGKILALGGSANDEDATTASLNADLYDPASNSFSSAGANAYPRLYHSVSLLLPDATIWIAGSNPARGNYESHMESYQPAYLFTRDGNNNLIAATRPTIASAPANIAWGGQFSVSTPDAANISQAVLVRPGSSTHSFDFDQRLVGMSFTAGSGSLTVTAPPNSKIAPPGYYMLFLINNKGVPSVAKFVLLSSSGGNPAPTVSAISPNTGMTNGGTGVTITGTGFQSGATVSLGGTAATGVNVVSSTSITATTLAHSAGAVSVVVTNTDTQTGSLNNGYTYSNSAPTITSITPNTGTTAGGTSVTITGTGFLTGATVSLGGTAATNVTVVSGTSITAKTPAHAAGAVNVVVTNTDAQNGSLNNGYTYTNPAPTVTSIAPSTGPANGGTGLTITGTNFLSGATVSFGGTAATGVTVASSTSITSTAPAHAAGTVDVVFTNPDGQSGTLPSGYAYTAAGEVSLGLGVPYGDPNSETIAAGQTASYTLSIGGAGMNGTASITCTGAPTSATCSLPASQAFNATTSTTFVIKVATTARITAALRRPAFAPASSTPASSTPASWLWTIALGMLFVPGTRVPKWSVRKSRRYLWLAPLMLLFFTVSCGGGGSMGNQQPQQNGTPSGTYSVVVHASSGSKTGSTSLTLIVQ
jgi:galactose oxidase-like protein/IPT/TIG domain-containing protein/glyoxal oxidase-like protein